MKSCNLICHRFFRQTKRVLRDISDLVSNGWCPPPSSVGNRICTLLVQIALDGLSPIIGDSSEEDILPDDEICRESCAAESLALLKNLASHDVLPLDSVELIASSLCRLLSASEKALSSAATTGDSTNNATMEEEIIIQRTFVASNSAELLWILLSTERTCCLTCDALLHVIDSRIESESENVDSDNEGGAANKSDAISAVRALSAALWGKIDSNIYSRCIPHLSSPFPYSTGDPPAVQGVPLLR